MRDADLMNRANTYADGVIADVLSELGTVKRIALRVNHAEKLAAARTIIARAFVIGFAAGIEDAAKPRRVR